MICAKARSLAGTPYNFLDIAYMALAKPAHTALICPEVWRVLSENRVICSQLVAMSGYAGAGGRRGYAVSPAPSS